MKTITQRMAEWRKKEKLTQDELARLLSLPVSTISKWEQSGRTPRGLYAEKLEAFLERVGA